MNNAMLEMKELKMPLSKVVRKKKQMIIINRSGDSSRRPDPPAGYRESRRYGLLQMLTTATEAFIKNRKINVNKGIPTVWGFKETLRKDKGQLSGILGYELTFIFIQGIIERRSIGHEA